MSKCSKKCNEIKQKIDSISGLDDDVVFFCLNSLYDITTSIIKKIERYEKQNKLNGTCFSKEKDYD